MNYRSISIMFLLMAIMTGTASAAGFNFYDQYNNGTAYAFHLTVTEPYREIHFEGTGYDLPNTFTVWINGVQQNSIGAIDTGDFYADPSSPAEFDIIFMNDKGAAIGYYEYATLIQFRDRTTLKNDGFTFGFDITVPEFPTVALPIAAVIGLVFVFSNRKRKEE